ncbi:Pleckstrin -like proteiny domain-containing family F member 1 [Collichthys lucidus]|uniref:Pleckstrin-like proteiny domain-containing family F member 1 n=1 Tax=Collichthys lucidus TaxID=240159 RepID=A0A4U5VVS9_COLLU|nr:Pleckstrin -like proteiny domain-containing family F member 1 [Collichthys lucidus]
MDHLTFDKANSDRIKAVENSFGTSGNHLSKPGRVLMGEGRLMKQGRRKPQPRVFFLFNDVLVYGSIILNGRWHKKQKVIRLGEQVVCISVDPVRQKCHLRGKIMIKLNKCMNLALSFDNIALLRRFNAEDILLEDLEDGEEMRNRWLIRTPRKSFFVSASTPEEKRAWIDHIENCRSSLLQDGSCQPHSKFASSWIPNQAAFKCMRCLNKFTTTKRRHHCRKCGFLVCNSCSKQRAVIDHIHPTKKLRVCMRCHSEDETSRVRGDSAGKSSSEEEDVAAISDEGERGEDIQGYTQSSWLDTREGTWGHTGIYSYPRPMHLRP